MCGIVGLLLADTGAFCRQELFDGLTMLQHRGQDAAGIVTASTSNRQTKLHMHKGLGLVRDVFSVEEMLKLHGNAGIAHCRYPTAGASSKDEAQPMYNNYPCGLALAHNGNLTNAEELQAHMRAQHRHLNSFSDSEALLNVFAEELRQQLDARAGERSARIEPDAVFAAVERTMRICRGGYAVLLLIHDVGVLAFRDPWGIRPLCVGSRESRSLPGGVDYIFASESVAMDTLGFKLLRDVRPGEAVLAVPMVPRHPRKDLGMLSRQLVTSGVTLAPCIFEYVYFARPDSIMNGVSVYQARTLMGVRLAEKIQREHPGEQIDVVMPIPDTSRVSAYSCATTLGRPYSEGFIKNRYIGRTFIMPEQSARKKSVRLKLNTVRSEFEGRNVLLVDDSIVRGTTSNELVQMAREAGAKKVFFCSASPEIRWPNVYGVDLPSRNELIAHGRNLDQIAGVIGADWVLFQALDDMLDSVRRLNAAELDKFEDSTFSGHYITNDVDAKYFDRLCKVRSNDLKKLSDLATSSSSSAPDNDTDSRPDSLAGDSRAASPTSRHTSFSPSRVASPSPSHVL